MILLAGISPLRPRAYSYVARYCGRGYHELSFLNHGEPSDVLEYYRQDDRPPACYGDDTAHYVQVEMLHAPWNPADKNTIQGRYPSHQRHSLPAPPSAKGDEWHVAGAEGWGRVVDTFSRCSSQSQGAKFALGDYVTFGQSGRGTFRSSLWLPEQALIRVQRGRELEESIGSAAASTLYQLGGTAWRLLQDNLTTLGVGNSTIIQNAGNSGVGFMISQLAAVRQMNVISLVRRGSKSNGDFEKLVEYLKQSHAKTNFAHVVAAEEDLLGDREALSALLQSFSAQSLPQVAINAAGGESASLLLKMLAPGGVMVTYGGMSMKPVTVATPQLIFKNLRLRGYWHSRWMAQSFSKQKEQMIGGLVNEVLDHNVQCPPLEVFALSRMHDAFQFESRQSEQAIRRKVVFSCGEE